MVIRQQSVISHILGGLDLNGSRLDVCSQKQTMYSDGLGSDSSEEGDHYGDNREETLIVEDKKST